jgi:elongation factor P
MSISTSEFKIGTTIMYNNEPFKIIKCEFMNPGKGSAVYRTKLRGLKSDKVLEVTFKSGEMVEEAKTDNRKMQYLYSTGTAYAFMDNGNFEQYEIEHDLLGEKGKFLKEGLDIFVSLLDGIPFDIQLPPKMEFKIVSTIPGVKGDTATGGSKPATLENGVVVTVPLFIKEGETIRINTESGEYVERAKEQ